MTDLVPIGRTDEDHTSDVPIVEQILLRVVVWGFDYRNGVTFACYVPTVEAILAPAGDLLSD